MFSVYGLHKGYCFLGVEQVCGRHEGCHFGLLGLLANGVSSLEGLWVIVRFCFMGMAGEQRCWLVREGV